MKKITAYIPPGFASLTALILILLGITHLFVWLLIRDAGFQQLASIVLNPLIACLGGIMLLAAARSLKVAGVGIRRVLAWTILGVAILSAAAGDITWMVYEMLYQQVATPSLANGFYALFYVLLLVGVSFIPARFPSLSEWLKISIDMLIVLLTAFMALWVYVLGTAFYANLGAPLVSQFVVMIYPLGDVLLLWALLIVLFSAAMYPLRRSLWLVGLGLLFSIVGGVGYTFLALQSEYVTGSWTDVAYSLGYLCFALAGYLELIMARRRQVHHPQPAAETPMWVQVMPYGWVVLAYWILVVTMLSETTLSSGRAAMFVGLITLFVVLRQVIFLHENRRLSLNLRRLVQQVKQQANELEQANREMHIEILERRRMAERLSYDAMHDNLTGLPNRALFLDRLSQAARKKQRQASLLYSVMFLDLDGFKLVNDSLGHVLGDRLLIRVAGILRGCVRATDTVARLGGDEFVILVEDVNHSRSVVEMANRVQTELHQPIDLDGTPVYITTSIGIVTTVNDYERPEDLLRDADLAMYHAKSLGKARYAIFNPAMRTVAVTRLAMENELRAAIERGEFFLEYQPVFNLANRQPVGFEALLRWKHPEQGRLEPGTFVAVAEEAGLMLPIGRWCLYEACRQARAWQARFELFGPLQVGVNISGRQFREPGFVDMVREILEANSLPGQSLLLEVPENICLENLDTLRSVMGDLSALGVEIQVDDFGTGYSSLGYLQRLPVHAIKIDRTFIEPISVQGDPRAPEIVRAILAMMRTLGVETWAEGIETELQLKELVGMNCQQGQGYYLASPMLPGEVEEWMKNRPAPAIK